MRRYFDFSFTNGKFHLTCQSFVDECTANADQGFGENVFCSLARPVERYRCMIRTSEPLRPDPGGEYGASLPCIADIKA